MGLWGTFKIQTTAYCKQVVKNNDAIMDEKQGPEEGKLGRLCLVWASETHRNF
jgi:hypothetical protein